MTNAFITDIENIPAEVKSWFETSPTVHTIETDGEAIATSAWTYIKSNGLTTLYSMAMALLTGAATGTSFTALGTQLLQQGETAGIQIAKGAEGIVLAQAQADLVAAGSIVSPTSGAIVTSGTGNTVTGAAAPATPAA
jgi:hypothetical protein